MGIVSAFEQRGSGDGDFYMLLSLIGRQPLLMIITQEFVKEVNSIIADESSILFVYEIGPRLLGEPAKNVVVLRIEFNIVFVKVFEQFICS